MQSDRDPLPVPLVAEFGGQATHTFDESSRYVSSLQADKYIDVFVSKCLPYTSLFM